jgi:mono/diheme cytochrome c family protein
MTIRTHKPTALLAAACAFLCLSGLAPHAFAQSLPDGKGKAEFIHNCTACHRADMVIRVRKTPGDWRKSVDEMAARGTDGTTQDLDNVVLYLDKYFALPAPAPADAKPSPTPSTPNGSVALKPSEIARARRVIDENSCLTCHRIEQQGAGTAPSLNGAGTRHTPDEIRASILSHPPTSSLGNTLPASSYEKTITGEDLDDLVRYLVSLPPLPQ